MENSEVINIRAKVSKELAHNLKDTDGESFEIFKNVFALWLKTMEQNYGDGRKEFVMEPIK